MEVGFPEAQADFIRRHESFLEKLPHIKIAIDVVIFNALRKELPDKVIYFLTRIVSEDFNEILILCANGLSTGGMKILRGMFERVVTVGYLTKYPEKTDLFWNFYRVSQQKQIRLITEVFPDVLKQETIDNALREYEAVKKDYEVNDCKKCQTKRINFAWLPDNILAMAKQVGGLEPTILHSYYRPLEETHPSAGAIVRRAKFTGEDSFTFDDEAKPEEDKFTLFSAHFLLLKALEAAQEHFKLEELKAPLQKCLDDYVEVWELNIKADES